MSLPDRGIFLCAGHPRQHGSLTRTDRLIYVGVDALFSGVQVALGSATCEFATQGKVVELFRSNEVTTIIGVSAYNFEFVSLGRVRYRIPGILP